MTNESGSQRINLTTEDFETVMGIIDTVCQRGAFRADEMAAVGNVYGKFKAIHQAIIQNQAAEKEKSENVGKDAPSTDEDTSKPKE